VEHLTTRARVSKTLLQQLFLTSSQRVLLACLLRRWKHRSLLTITTLPSPGMRRSTPSLSPLTWSSRCGG